MTSLSLRAAKGYASLNLPTCPVLEKSPAFRGGHGWGDATTDEAALAALFASRQHTGVGVATGKRAGVWVLDGDGAPGRRSLRQLIQQHGNLPCGPLAITGGDGFHLWFAWDSRCAALRNRVRFADGLDVRTTGGGGVVPPSIHADTRRYYQWRAGRSPYELSFPSAPDWLLSAIVDIYQAAPVTPVTVEEPIVRVADR